MTGEVLSQDGVMNMGMKAIQKAKWSLYNTLLLIVFW